MALLSGVVQQQAAVMALDYTFYIVGLLFIIALPLILLLYPPPRRPAPQPHRLAHPAVRLLLAEEG